MSTATTLPFMGGEMGSFDPVDSATIETTAAGTFDSAMSRCSIICGSATTYCTSPTWPAASTFWMHCRLYKISINIGIYTGAMMQLLNAGTVVAQWFEEDMGNGAFQITVQTLQSGVLTTVGSVTLTSQSLLTLDMQLVAGASGSVALYSSGTKVVSGSGLNHAGFTGVTQIKLMGSPSGTSNSPYWSQVICDTVPHVGDVLKTFPIDTASAVNTGYTGPVGNVDEIVYNDANFVSASASGQISTYYANGLSLTGDVIIGVGVGVRARCGVTGPQNIKVAIRVGGGNYVSTTMALNAGFQACAASWTTNPATSAAWSPSTAASVEGGMEAIT